MKKLTTNSEIKKLLDSYKQISLLGKISAVLEWDLNVNLPEKGAEARAAQSAYLAEQVTDKWLEPEFRKVLDEVFSKVDSLNETEQAIVRNLKRASRYYYQVPKEIIIEKAKTTSQAYMVWQKAKKENKFLDFLPYLEKLVELDQIIAKHLGFKTNPYDALLDQYEPGLTADFCAKVFSKLQPELTKLLKKIQASKVAKEKSELLGAGLVYPEAAQRQLSSYVLKKMNYDLQAGRMDVSAHPFTTTLGAGDVRITSWFHEDDFRESLMACMHETGHALYEQGILEEYESTPLEGGVSYAIHESQSRFWENQIGRSPIFIEYLTPLLQAFYPQQLGEVGTDTLVRLFNEVKPSFIRVEADEVTYCLHIIIRFEIENDLINGKLKAKEVPRVWNQKMKKYLGVVPPTDRQGCLQDVHWSMGAFGYFPTYALGSLYAAQFTEAMKKEIDVEGSIKKGELGTVLSWLRSNIHQYGSLYYPDDLATKITGKKLDPTYFVNYLKSKYSKIYQLK